MNKIFIIPVLNYTIGSLFYLTNISCHFLSALYCTNAANLTDCPPCPAARDKL